MRARPHRGKMTSIHSGRRGLTFEQICMRDALQRHVHHSDHRAGMQRHRPAEPSAEECTKSSVTKGLLPATLRVNVPERKAPRSPPQGDGTAFLMPKGTMDVKVPSCTSAPVRCRISRCVETSNVTNEEDIARWFRTNCNWQRPATLAIGRGRILSERPATSPSATLLPPSSGSQQNRSRSGDGFRQSRRGALKPNTTAQWSFLQHMPDGHQVRQDAGTSGHLGDSIGRKHRGSLTMQQVIISDISALLWARGVKKGAIEAARLVEEVPPATAERWWWNLQPKRRREAHTSEAVARQIVKVLGERKDRFRVGEADPVESSRIALDPSYRPEAAAAPEGKDAEAGAGGEKRWTAILPLLGRLEELAKAVQASADFPVNRTGVEVVARALERAESLRLCGGLASARDQLQCHWNRGGVGQVCALRTKSESKTIPGEWVVLALANVPDDDGLEVGDSVRLLEHVATGLTKNPGTALTKQAFVTLCRVSTSVDTINGLENLFDAVVSVFHQFGVDEFAMSCCGPLLLELLLQGVAHSSTSSKNASSCKELIGSMLWLHCGWDSPIGRRLLRRMCRAYDAYSSAGAMSNNEFFRFCHDAGLTTRRDVVDKHKRFNAAFTDLMGETEKLQFDDFLALFQTFADQATTSTWQAFEGCIASLGGTAASKSQKASTSGGVIATPKRARPGVVQRTNTEATPMSSKMLSSELTEESFEKGADDWSASDGVKGDIEEGKEEDGNGGGAAGGGEGDRAVDEERCEDPHGQEDDDGEENDEDAAEESSEAEEDLHAILGIESEDGSSPSPGVSSVAPTPQSRIATSEVSDAVSERSRKSYSEGSVGDRPESVVDILGELP